MPESHRSIDEASTVPGIASIIFAPAQLNYTLSVVTMRMQLWDAFAQEYSSGLGRFVLTTTVPGSTTKDMSENFQRGTSSITQTISSPMGPAEGQIVAARQFPFVRHYDFLSSPVEGIFFDPDDFVDR